MEFVFVLYLSKQMIVMDVPNFEECGKLYTKLEQRGFIHYENSFNDQGHIISRDTKFHNQVLHAYQCANKEEFMLIWQENNE
tara:strand:+ start:699 stop:944 length:246 start_codon:yes stop_codon:yes gene_type:complete